MSCRLHSPAHFINCHIKKRLTYLLQMCVHPIRDLIFSCKVLWPPLPLHKPLYNHITCNTTQWVYSRQHYSHRSHKTTTLALVCLHFFCPFAGTTELFLLFIFIDGDRQLNEWISQHFHLFFHWIYQFFAIYFD